MDEKEASIVLATSGMMNGGPVMEYFKAWAAHEENGMVFSGYQAEGTFGRRLQSGMTEATMNDNGKTLTFPIRHEMVNCEGFSGHSDRVQLVNYVATLDPRPQRIMICHGEENRSLDLAASLHKRFGMETRVPYNLETVRVL
jgi:hypothetical protein